MKTVMDIETSTNYRALTAKEGAVVQALLCNICVTKTEVSLLLGVKGRTEIENAVLRIEKALEAFGYRLGITMDEVEGELVYLLQDSSGDIFEDESGEEDEVSTDEEEDGLLYGVRNKRLVYAVCEAILEKGNMVGSIELIESVYTKCKREFGRGEIEEKTDAFVEERWFDDNGDGSYSLGPRAVVEWGEELKERYGDIIQVCSRCCFLATKVVLCKCEKVFHQVCVKKCDDCGMEPGKE
eukprot:GHVN01058387.1.p1 GENE.GHVN01058387.1~~GHVN01058387.1.p1  ORF type:complete len:240 (-),score=38.06 GHVN01058387.1:146-865(-)